MVKYYIIGVSLFLFLLAGNVFSEEKNDDPVQKQKRPDHIHTFLYQRIEGPDEIINSCDVSLIDAFTINGSSKINNYFFFTYNNCESDVPVPAELYKIRENFSFSIDKVRFLFGFANNTNRPFRSYHDLTINSAAYYEIYRDGGHTIQFSVVYSSLINRNIGLPIPIPLINYTFENKELDLVIGMLTMLEWRPVDYFTLRCRYIPVSTVNVSFEFRPLPFLILGTEYSYDKDVYLVNEREDTNENLFYEYQRVGERISCYVHRNISLIVFAGYQFGASYIYGRSEFKRYQGEYRVRYVLDNAYIIQAGFRVLF